MKENKEDIKKTETRRKPSHPTKNKRKHNKKIVKVVICVTLVLFVLSLLFILGFGIYKLSTSPKYNIKNIVFEGNVEYNNDLLKERLEMWVDTNLFRASKGDIESKLKELPYINMVKISKKYPDTLLIKITEYLSYFFAYNKERDNYVKLTSEGIILEECKSDAREEHELIVFGINFDDKLGKRIVEVEQTKLTNYFNIKEQYDKTGFDKVITSVEFKEGDIILTLDHDINVIMNLEDIGYKLSLLKSILLEITNEAGTIDMTVENPIFRANVK